MQLREIAGILEEWAPQELAWDRDNVGVQVGTPTQQIRRILVALDITDTVVREARRRRADLIISHHPLLFHPLRSVRDDERVGRIVAALLRSKTAAYAMHTNLDAAPNGVSFALAEALGLEEVEILERGNGTLSKLVTFVPPSHLEAVAAAMGTAGAGVIGRYEHCSFRVEGVGSYRPVAGAHPYAGKIGKLERATEVRLEMVVPAGRLDAVVQALRQTHPYEEVAYDVYRLEAPAAETGMGAVGILARPMPLQRLISRVQTTLRVPVVRYAASRRKLMRRVAVCGGSGSELLETAIRRGADALITADIRFHSFQAADGRIALIDAGHFETEWPIVRRIADYLRRRLKMAGRSVDVSVSNLSTNFVQYSTQ